jgi:hypothetical protein
MGLASAERVQDAGPAQRAGVFLLLTSKRFGIRPAQRLLLLFGELLNVGVRRRLKTPRGLSRDVIRLVLAERSLCLQDQSLVQRILVWRTACGQFHYHFGRKSVSHFRLVLGKFAP